MTMEIHEFAQRVLFASSLEEKLDPGERLTDDEPGKAITGPEAPGRPVDLRIRRNGARVDFPAEARLMDDEQRGILLHFFANHELLATELMALVLLKFPEAPKAFRRGIVRTLREEQEHTRWYMRRMRECGVRFGDFPVNGFFWEAIAPMETPLDYVTRLSLTFEQANLDYSRHYAWVMKAAGDPATAGILDRIYRDEIGHVGYGLRWFRKWKERGSCDWDAYRRQLAFPLSPSRGKGNVAFNAEGRRRAGLDESFIRELEVFSQSRGRTPNVFTFHPDAEAAMAGGLDGRGFEPRAEIKALAADLGILPAFLARRDDVLLVREMPQAEHRRRLQALGFELPEFEETGADGKLRPESLLRERKINGLFPWAWCPQSAALLEPLLGNLPVRARRSECWNDDVRALFSKKWDLERARELADRGEPGTVGEADVAGFFCENVKAFGEAIDCFFCHGWNLLIAKAPFGAAGQKNIRVEPGAVDKAIAWASRILDRQGGVIVEPCLDRVFDFSIHYDLTESGLLRRSFVWLINDRRGQFRAAVSAVKFGSCLDRDVGEFLLGYRGRARALSVFDDAVPAVVEPALRGAGYRGPLGIDAFVYRSRKGNLVLRPIVEINPRFTMGRVAWELMKRVEPGHSVRLEVISRSALVQAGFPGFSAFAADLSDRHPPATGRSGRLASGSVILNDPAHARQSVAVLTVATHTQRLRQSSERSDRLKEALP